MDIFNLDITSISLIGLLKILIKLFDLLAAKGNSEFQRGNTIKNEYIANCGGYTASFAKDLHNKTVFFLNSYFKKEDLAQIFEKQEIIKEEPPKQTQSSARVIR